MLRRIAADRTVMSETTVKPAASYWSCIALGIAVAAMMYCSLFFYPRYRQAGNNATLSWDAMGYYAYLPSVFIYKDIKQFHWADSIIHRYQPGPAKAEELGARSDNGNVVLKYGPGVAIGESPAFLIAHALARPMGYQADGFSRPYQAAVQFGALLNAILGLWLLRRFLRHYYTDGVVAAVLLIIVIGSNYLNYSAIDGGLSHTWLFTAYAGLLLASHSFYQKPAWKTAAIIGLLCGWAFLIRATDIIAVLIPLLWTLPDLKTASRRRHLRFLAAQRLKLAVAAGLMLMIASVQLIYWKSVSGHWLYNAYGDQGFSWLHPHLLNYSISYKSGWLTYTPAMALSLIGLVYFLRRGASRVAILTFLALAFYIVTAWDIWWYSGSGGRAMVQYYPALAMPLAALLQWLGARRLRAWASLPIIAALCYINIWFTYHAHAGSLYDAEGNMTGQYFWRVIGRWSAPEETLKLRDGRYLYEGPLPQNAHEIYRASLHGANAQGEDTMLLMSTPERSSPDFGLPFRKEDGARWLRASATFHCDIKEWTFWKMTQFVIGIRKGGVDLDNTIIRVHRLLSDGETKNISVDFRLPRHADADSIYVRFVNTGTREKLWIERLEVQAF